MCQTAAGDQGSRRVLIEAIKRFAGEDYEIAKYYDFDGDYLIEKEPKVRHYQSYDR